MQIIKEKMAKPLLFLLIFVLCGSVLAVILFGVRQFQIGSQLASVDQVSHLSHLLVRQQTNLFSFLIVNNAKRETLLENLDQLTQEGFVLDASLYATNGELLAQTGKLLNVRHQLGLEEKNEDLNIRQIVEPIYSANNVVGFLRVTFDSKYGQRTQKRINQIFHRLYGELLIVLLTGGIFASALHYCLSQYCRTKKKAVATVAVKTKPNRVNTFHRRRRKAKF